MPSDETVSPEEKLLKVIQTGRQTPSSPGSGQQRAAPDEPRSPPRTATTPSPAPRTGAPGRPAAEPETRPTAPLAPRPTSAVAPSAPAEGHDSRRLRPLGGKNAGQEKPTTTFVSPGQGTTKKAADTPPIAPAVPRRKDRPMAGSVIKIINRLLAAACVLLLAGLAWELGAAKPAVPRASEPRAGSDPDTEREIAPLGPFEPMMALVRKRDIFVAPSEQAIVSNRWDSFAGIEREVKKLRLEGVSASRGDPAKAVAVVSGPDAALIRYLRVGDQLPMPKDVLSADQPRPVVGEIRENEVVVVFQDKRILLGGRR